MKRYPVTIPLLISLLVSACAVREAVGPGAVPPTPAPKTRAQLLLLAEGCADKSSAEARVKTYQSVCGALPDYAVDRDVALACSRCAASAAEQSADQGFVLEAVAVGMDAADRAGCSENDPAACYYKAVNMGLGMRLQGLEAVSKLAPLIELLKIAAAEPGIEQGGPWRVLGMVYLRAPAWPLGPGDMDAAAELLRRAAETYPAHPQNHLFYAEVLAALEETEAALKELDLAEQAADPAAFGEAATRWRVEAGRLRAKLSRPNPAP